MAYVRVIARPCYFDKYAGIKRWRLKDLRMTGFTNSVMLKFAGQGGLLYRPPGHLRIVGKVAKWRRRWMLALFFLFFISCVTMMSVCGAENDVKTLMYVNLNEYHVTLCFSLGSSITRPSHLCFFCGSIVTYVVPSNGRFLTFFLTDTKYGLTAWCWGNSAEVCNAIRVLSFTLSCHHLFDHQRMWWSGVCFF